MPRRREVPKRRIIPDPKFKDKLVSKFTNTLMYDGKKAVALVFLNTECPVSNFYAPEIERLAKLYGDFISEGALRALIWSAEAYEKDPKPGLRSNGFLPVIVRPPHQRKVLLDRVEFEKWLTSQQRTAR